MTVTKKIKTKGSPFFGFWLLFAIIAGGSLIGGVSGIYKAVSRQRLVIAEKETVSNALQIGRALHKFESQYGSFPDEQTKFEFDKSYVHKVSVSGISSNALFRQLIAPDIASEDIFYAHIPKNQKPDSIVKKGHALEPGEVGFSYIAGLTSTGADPLTPIVLTPLIPGTSKFDPKPFDGKAVVLRIDNSVRHYDIHKDGHVYDKGINLLSPAHPIWKGKAPDIRYPE